MISSWVCGIDLLAPTRPPPCYTPFMSRQRSHFNIHKPIIAMYFLRALQATGSVPSLRGE